MDCKSYFLYSVLKNYLDNHLFAVLPLFQIKQKQTGRVDVSNFC
jgi:hypothetical protein